MSDYSDDGFEDDHHHKVDLQLVESNSTTDGPEFNSSCLMYDEQKTNPDIIAYSS
jgi:hypothetical protein